MNKLPFHIDLNEVDILKELNTANYHIGELKGILKILPNPGIVLSLINLSESKDSSAIENIMTTYDEIFKEIVSKTPIGGKPKEVINYKHAIDRGLLVMRQKGFISTNILVEIQNVIEPNKGGIRKLSGTVIINDKTNAVEHTPPQNEIEILELMRNLELFINQNDDYDPLIQMALIHFQFESIHPFYDGNGRTARLLLNFELIQSGYPPVVIKTENRADYYDALDKAHTTNNYTDFIKIIVDLVNESENLYLYLIG